MTQMKRTKIKVCGMRDPQNIASVAELRPDYIGFIFYRRSVRYAGELPREVLRALPEEICKVGVFVNASHNEICSVVDKYGLDIVQLHGDESAAFCASIRKVRPVIKSVGIGSADDMKFYTNLYADSVDYLHFDTQTPLFGGSGKRFDWEILEEYGGGTPFFLGGGVGPEDAVHLKNLRLPALHAVDVNSRFETAPALKDTELLKEFIKTVKI